MAKKTLKIADKPTLDSMKSLLENETYGLSKIKSSISGISGEMAYPNITVGFLNGTSPLVVNGKGRITLYNNSGYSAGVTDDSKIDGVNIKRIWVSQNNNIVLEFEKSISLTQFTGSNVGTLSYIIQLAD